MALSREKLKSSFETKRVHIDMIDDDVYLRDISVSQLAKIDPLVEKEMKKRGVDTEEYRQFLNMILFVQSMLVDENDKRLYDKLDFESIENEMSSRLLAEIGQHCKFGADDDEDDQEDGEKKD